MKCVDETTPLSRVVNRLKRGVASGLPKWAGGWRRHPNAVGRRGLSWLEGAVILARLRARRLFRARDLVTFRELAALAWPITAGMLGEAALGLVDTKLVGGLGAGALAGVGLATVLMYLSYSVVFGLMRGVKVRTAYALGLGRPADGVRYAQAGLLVGAGVGAVVFVLCRDVTPLLQWLRVDPITIAPARDFLAARTTAAVATCALAALIQHRQGIGDARTPMAVGIAGNLVNAALAYGLIHGAWGLPALGVRGAGYATASTEVLELVAMLALLGRDTLGQRGEARLSFRAALREVLTLGLPMGLHWGFETLAFTTFNAVLASLGAAELAASHLAINTLRASFLPGVAIGEAASVLVAAALARRRLGEADRVVKLALALAVSFMGLCGVVFGLCGGAIAGAFTDDPEVARIASRLFLVAAAFQVLDAVNMVLRCALRGAKDVTWVAVVGTTVCWTTIPAAAYVFGELAHLGALGGWLGFLLETTLGATLMWRRWSRGPFRAAMGERAPAPVLSLGAASREATATPTAA
ncbi:MAG TPA: MATE family efflux transporter [Byssovorax sp.]|jgi:MATE family multidrug resistance protein